MLNYKRFMIYKLHTPIYYFLFFVLIILTTFASRQDIHWKHKRFRKSQSFCDRACLFSWTRSPSLRFSWHFSGNIATAIFYSCLAVILIFFYAKTCLTLTQETLIKLRWNWNRLRTGFSSILPGKYMFKFGKNIEWCTEFCAQRVDVYKLVIITSSPTRNTSSLPQYESMNWTLSTFLILTFMFINIKVKFRLF